jgi:hypothetical protein
MARKKKRPNCFHCLDTGSCDCAFCLIETLDGRKPGPCGFCAGRAETQAMYAFYESVGKAIDPRNANLWIQHAAADGNKGWREFIPLTVFRNFRKEGKV